MKLRGRLQCSDMSSGEVKMRRLLALQGCDIVVKTSALHSYMSADVIVQALHLLHKAIAIIIAPVEPRF